jgi:hypothetical protein
MQNDIQRTSSSNGMNKPSAPIQTFYNIKKIASIAVFLVIIVLLIIFIGGRFNNNSDVSSYHIGDGYQAIFVNNGETYFGKVIEVNDSVLVLDNVYYLQDQQSLQSGPQPKESELALIKLGSEIHGPQNQMIIPIDSISFIENLKETSAIVRAIGKSE